MLEYTFSIHNLSVMSTFQKANFCITAKVFVLQEIYKDRKKFSEQVFKVASSDLVNMGISVVSYTLKDVHDDQVSLCAIRIIS